jgi:hypothetical protein
MPPRHPAPVAGVRPLFRTGGARGASRPPLDAAGAATGYWDDSKGSPVKGLRHHSRRKGNVGTL